MDMKMKRLDINLLTKIILLALVFFGLWVSFHYTFYLWGPDSDICYSAMLWQGFHNYGLVFLKSVIYTQDNWLLSLIPIFFVLFSLFGANAYVVVVVGWLIYGISAILTGVIVRKVTNNFLLALAATVFSLFVGIYNYSASWMVYSNTHNISMLWVLVSFLIVIKILTEQKSKINIIYLICLFITTFISGFSDPWFNAAFNLPMVLALLVIYFKEKEQRQNSKGIILSIILSWFLSWFMSFTKVFGLLSVLSDHFVFISSLHKLIENFLLYSVIIASFFNILQAFDINFIFGIIFLILSIYVLIFTIVKLVSLIKNNLIQFSSLEKIVIYFSLISIIVISGAFLLSTFPEGLYASRFLYNIFYCLLILFIVLLNKISFNKKDKILMFLYIIFYIVIGISGKNQAWLNPEIKIKSLGVENLITTLEANNLHFGYGNYWSTEANSINVLTNGKITVVGITDSFSPHGETSSFYFNTTTIPKERYYFLVVPNSPTNEWHLSPQESLENAKKLFGDPVKVITLKNHTIIIIWDHMLDFNMIKLNLFSTLLSSSQKFLSEGSNPSKLLPQYLEENGYLDKSFGYQTATTNNWTNNGGWIGQWACPDGKGKCFGVGIVGDLNQVKPIIDKYKAQALQVFFPYPKIYNPNVKYGEGQLIMIFRDPKPNPTITKIPYTINFAASGNAQRFMNTGFCNAEKWGTWSCAKESSISFKFKNKELKKPTYMKLTINAFVSKNHPQRFEFYLNGKLISSKTYTIKDKFPQIIALDISNIVQNKNILVIKVPNAVSPKSLKRNNDTRELGIGLISIEFTN